MAAGARSHVVGVPVFGTERPQRQAGYYAGEGTATRSSTGRVPPSQHHPH